MIISCVMTDCSVRGQGTRRRAAHKG